MYIIEEKLEKDTRPKRNKEETELTTLLVLGEAPWLISWCTMLSCPINAATWIGVRPDCTERRRTERRRRRRGVNARETRLMLSQQD